MAGDACLRGLVTGLRGLGFLAERVTDWKDGFAIFYPQITQITQIIGKSRWRYSRVGGATGKDGFAIFLSTIECRGRHANEQAKVGPQGEGLGRSESNFAGFTDSSAFLGSLSVQVTSMCYLNINN